MSEDQRCNSLSMSHSNSLEDIDSSSASSSSSTSNSSNSNSSNSTTNNSSNHSRSFDTLKNQILGDAPDNAHENANRDNHDSSFDAFYEKEVQENNNDHQQQQLDRMSHSERQRQLDTLLNEVDEQSLSDRDSSRDASVGASTATVSIDVHGHVQAMIGGDANANVDANANANANSLVYASTVGIVKNENEHDRDHEHGPPAQISDNSPNSMETGSDNVTLQPPQIKMTQINTEMNMNMNEVNHEDNEVLEVLEVSSSSSSSDSSSSSGSSSASSAASNKLTLTEEGLSNIPVTVGASKSNQISEFDIAMTNVGRGEAHTKVSYSGSSEKGLSLQVNVNGYGSGSGNGNGNIDATGAATATGTSANSNSQHSNQASINNKDLSSPASIASVASQIEQVHTLDEDDDGMIETALETSLSLTLSKSKSRDEENGKGNGNGIDNGNGNDNGNGAHMHHASTNVNMNVNAPMPVEGQEVPLPSVNSNMYSQGTSIAASSMVTSSAASHTSNISLAQQIKQSIDQTPSKPLPKTIKPHQELPTFPIRHAGMTSTPTTIRPKSNDLKSNSLPDVLTSVRDKLDGLFDNERRGGGFKKEDEQSQLNRENLRKAFQQSVSAAVLVSLAHKRYERRRLAAMEIEKVVRTLVQNRDLERVRGILLLLSDDYVRSTNDDSRKGGVVAMAACAIGLKKAHDMPGLAGKTNECTDLILGSVVHACQDNSQRVRYYATESLFNVIKVLPGLAVDHFFILFEILSSLSADVDFDVRSGAKLLDKKLQGIIIGSVNAGQFDADTCVPLFARFLHMRNKQTKKLTLTWLQSFAENLIGAPLLEFLHLFLYDVFAMLADPSSNIHELALLFLNSMLPKLWVKNEDFEDSSTYNKVDFDKILQSLVTTMEHPDPFVRKVAMYWVFRIVQTHMGDEKIGNSKENELGSPNNGMERSQSNPNLCAASVSVRNALEHVLPGLLLSIGDTFQTRAKMRDTFLPDQTTQYLADRTNRCLQNNVKQEGRNYVSHLGGFVVALREELDTPGGLSGKNRTAKERKPYRMDVKGDGSGIESTGWFRANKESADEGDATGHENILSRLCALEWIVTLFEYVVPDLLKDEYADEFIAPVIRLLDNAPEVIVLKSLEVLSKITVSKSAEFDKSPALSANSSANVIFQKVSKDQFNDQSNDLQTHPMTHANATFALGILDAEDKCRLSRNREVFAALIKAHARNHSSVSSLSRIIKHMCALQPPEFIFISFGIELDIFIVKVMAHRAQILANEGPNSQNLPEEDLKVSKLLDFATKFVQVITNVLLTCKETERFRNLMKGSIGNKSNTTKDERKSQIFHILLKTFAHDPVAAISLCLWCGAFRTASSYIHKINPLDLNLSFYMELDQLVEFIERPLFRDLHLQMLECNENPALEGSGAMLYRVLKSMLMLLPQTTSYNILKERLLSVARFRQCAVHLHGMSYIEIRGTSAEIFVHRILEVRQLHCNAKWRSIRSESLEPSRLSDYDAIDINEGRRTWLGYADEQDEKEGKEKHRSENARTDQEEKDYSADNYSGFHKDGQLSPDDREDLCSSPNTDQDDSDEEDVNDAQWKEAWAEN